MKEKIINGSESFKGIKKLLKKYFNNVRVVKNKHSDMASKSQGFYKIILFESRGEVFSIQWDYAYCTLYLGDITTNEKTCLQYRFTKIRYNDCYPVEIGNNSHLMFWEYEISGPHDEYGYEISPLRLPVNNKK